MGDGPHMESWHVVGQKVVCVNASTTLAVPTGLEVDAVYTIASVKPGWLDLPIFTLDEIEARAPKQGFDASRFRPVSPRETSIECFLSFLTPTPEQVREMENA